MLHSHTGLVATVLDRIATEYFHDHKVLSDAIEMGDISGSGLCKLQVTEIRLNVC